MFQDRTLTCRECGAEFVFAAGEQEYFVAHGLVNEPRRCKSCRGARKVGEEPREAVEVVCDNCGTPTIVPFRPHGDKPVFCRECLRAIRQP